MFFSIDVVKVSFDCSPVVCGRCLNEYSFVCRAVSYDGTSRTCSLSRFTRRSHPEAFEDDPGFEYLENTCLSGNISKLLVI